MTQPKITVLIAEDNQLMRIGISGVLADAPDIAVLGTAEDGARAVTRYAELRPDVMLMDLNMPHMDGIQAIRNIIRAHPEAKILVLSHYDGPEQLTGALQAGAYGYLTKEERGEGIVAAVRSVSRGEKFLSPQLQQRLDAVSNQPVFTLREKQVIERIVKGQSNREIAEALGLSHKTISIYVSNLLEKLGVSNRTEAATAAVARGLLKKDPH